MAVRVSVRSRAWRGVQNKLSRWLLGQQVLLFVFFVLLGVVLSGPAPSQMQALEKLYSSTDGPHWNVLNSVDDQFQFIEIPGEGVEFFPESRRCLLVGSLQRQLVWSGVR